MKKIKIEDSCGNVFLDLGFPPAEAEVLLMRSNLMIDIGETIKRRKLTQVAAAKILGVSQARVSDLTRGKWDKFSLDMLVTFALRLGLRVSLARAA